MLAPLKKQSIKAVLIYPQQGQVYWQNFFSATTVYSKPSDQCILQKKSERIILKAHPTNLYKQTPVQQTQLRQIVKWRLRVELLGVSKECNYILGCSHSFFSTHVNVCRWFSDSFLNLSVPTKSSSYSHIKMTSVDMDTPITERQVLHC